MKLTPVFGQYDPGKTPHGENQFGVDVYKRSQRKCATHKTYTSELGTISTLLGCFGVP
jgi:hypothetical protein